MFKNPSGEKHGHGRCSLQWEELDEACTLILEFKILWFCLVKAESKFQKGILVMTCWISLSLSHLPVWCTRRDWFLGKQIPKGGWPHFLSQQAICSIYMHSVRIPDVEVHQRRFLGGAGFTFYTPWTNFPDLSPVKHSTVFQAEGKQLPFFSLWKTTPVKP